MRQQQLSTPSWQRLYKSPRELGLILAWQLPTRVRSPDIEDWVKLRHLMEYLRGDKERPLILGTDNEGMLMWYVDASFADGIRLERYRTNVLLVHLTKVRR